MTDQIKDFINRRFTQNCNWQNENSYYFAKILTARFPKLCLYYSPVKGHFVAGHDDIFYDSAGVVTLLENEEPIKWEDLIKENPSLALKITKDCIM